MGYELIPVGVTKYVINSKEIAKFFKGKQKWYTFAERIPREGEMIHSNMSGGKTFVVTDGDEKYFREDYTEAAKKHYKYVVLTKRKDYHIVWKLIYVNF